MAGKASLAIDGISLARLFTTCVDDLDYITLAGSYDRDLEVSLTRMSLLNQRLTSWGEIVKNSRTRDTSSPRFARIGLNSVALSEKPLCPSKTLSRTSRGSSNNMV